MVHFSSGFTVEGCSKWFFDVMLLVQ